MLWHSKSNQISFKSICVGLKGSLYFTNENQPCSFLLLVPHPKDRSQSCTKTCFSTHFFHKCYLLVLLSTIFIPFLVNFWDSAFNSCWKLFFHDNLKKDFCWIGSFLFKIIISDKLKDVYKIIWNLNFNESLGTCSSLQHAGQIRF